MKIKLIILLSLCSLLTCCKRANTSFSLCQLWNTEDDTIVVKRPLEPGLYQTKRIEYFLIVGKDTSKFKCIFSESKERQRVCIYFDCKLVGQKSKLYKERLEELKIIVNQKASKDFDLSHLSCLGFGLLSSGDLAIEISREYEKRIGVNVVNSKELRNIIYDSRLRVDLNKIFKPYHNVVEKIDVEKLFFADRESLYKNSEVETNKADIPQYILDCPVVVYFKAK